MKLKTNRTIKRCFMLFLLASISLLSYAQVAPDWTTAIPCNFKRTPTDFHIQLKDSSTIGVHNYACTVVGDMNGDGIPEIAVASNSRVMATKGGVVNGAITTDSMLIFNGSNLKQYVEFKLPALYATSGAMAIARGKVGGVDTTLLIVALQDKYLYAYNSAGVQVWKSNAFYTQDTATARNVKVSVADIMGNGNVEIVADNGIFNFDGKLLLAMDAEFPVQQEAWAHGGQNSYVLADMNGDKKLDYVCASEVYTLDIPNYLGAVGNSMTLYSSLAGFKLTKIYPGSPSPNFDIAGVAPGNTAVVDMTGDGKLEVVVNNVNGLYVWSPQAGAGVLIDSVAIPLMRFATPFTGDIDGSHVPNILFCSIDSLSQKYIYSFKFDRATKKLSLFWKLAHTDLSGATGMTLFDFNADGIMEICYRDQTRMRIINGSMKSHITGADTTVYDYASFVSGSGTMIEYPTVADVDGSGSANLVVVGTSSGIYNVGQARLNIYSSVKPGAWAWARPVWNQYMYNGINVNQDLTIPQVQIPQGSWVIRDSVATGLIPRQNNVNDSVQPYNSFFQQHSLESGGKYILVGSALAIGNVTQAPNATNDSIVFTIPVTNTSLRSGYPAVDSAIAFYCGDSLLHNVLWVGAMPFIGPYTGTGPIPAVNAVVAVPASVLASCTSQLTIVLNDKGNGTGDSTLPGECDYTGQAATVCASFINDDNASMLKGASQEIRVRDNDVILQPITGIDASRAHIGSAVLNFDSTITYTSDGVNVGVDSILYYTNVGCLDSAWLYVTVTDTLDWTNAFGCQVAKQPVSFAIKLKQSSQQVVHNCSPVIAGDMDGDGVDEIVAYSMFVVGPTGYRSDTVFIFQGNDLNKYTKILLPASISGVGPSMAMVRGKLAGVDTSLLIMALTDRYLYAYNKAGQQVWKSDSVWSNLGTNYNKLTANVSVADLDNDGNVEIVAGDAIFTLDGTKLLDFSDIHNNDLMGYNTEDAGMVALADMTGNGRLNYVAGNAVWNINLTNKLGVAGNSMTLLDSLPGFGKGGVMGWGAKTTVADLDGDGKLDVVVTSSKGFYVWDGQTPTLMDSVMFVPVAPLLTGWFHGTPFVGDIDGDGKPEMIFCSAPTANTVDSAWIYSYKYDVPTKKLKLFWKLNHSDHSGETGMSLFDFNADGIMEIVYRDQSNMRIINGSMKSHLTGLDTTEVYNLASIPCSSGTLLEMPLVVDADGSGSANIVVAGWLDTVPHNNLTPTTLNIFSSVKPGAWAYARPVWNQYMYNAVNVNNDLTVPIVQTNPAQQLWDSISGKIVQPYNSFFQQHSYEDQAGNYITFGANLSIGNVTQAPDSTGDSIVFTIPIKNLAMHMGYPASDSAVAFYCGNASGPVLWVGALPQISMNDSAVAVVSVPKSVLATCNNGIFIQLNDKGQGNGLAGGMQQECDLSNESATVCVNLMNDDFANILKGSSQEVHVRDNDSIQESITSIDVSRLHIGSAVLNLDSTITYTSDGSGVGVDSIIYYANNPSGCLDSAWLYVAVVDTLDWTGNFVCPVPPQPADFRIKLKQSSAKVVNNFSASVLGDMNGDGVCEIAALNKIQRISGRDWRSDTVFLFQGNDLSKITNIVLPTGVYASNGANPMAMARDKYLGVDTSLLLIAGSDYYLYAYNSQGGLVWKSDSMYTYTASVGDEYVVVSVADINNDGKTEILVGKSIFSFSGIKLLDMSSQLNSATNQQMFQSSLGMMNLADMTGDGKLNLVYGNSVWNIDLPTTNGVAGNSMALLDSLPGFDNVNMRAPKSTVVDLDGDGKLDVVVCTNSALYVWNGQTPTLMDSVAFNVNMTHSTPFVGDIDGDGLPEIVFVGCVYGSTGLIYAYKYDIPTHKLKLFWTLPHSDVSGATGMTLFDFNSDGIMEIVYRDQTDMRIINGSLKSHLTGLDTAAVYNLATIPCYSATISEYPLIADVDGSGSANIVVVGDLNSPLVSYNDVVTMNIFSSVKAGAWAWARPVWNQYMYNAVNVNDNLTIPKVQMNPATQLYDSTSGKIVQPYNSFFQQRSHEDMMGNYVRPGVNLNLDSSFQTTNATGDSVLFTMYITNLAQISPYPAMDSAVAFYCGGSVAGPNGPLLWVDSLPLIKATKQVKVVATIPLSKLLHCSNQIYIQVNDKGQGAGLPGGMMASCDTTNNGGSISLSGYDFGDAPDTFRTVYADTGAYHLFTVDTLNNKTGALGGDGVPDLLLGDSIYGGDSLSVAWGADNNLPNGDQGDDGIAFLPDVSKYMTVYGTVVKVTNATTDTAFVSAWLDYNRNGQFEDAERIIDTIIPVAGTPVIMDTLLWKNINFKQNGIDSTGTNYMRVRVSTVAQLKAYGYAPNGEVEDYMIKVTPPSDSIIAKSFMRPVSAAPTIIQDTAKTAAQVKAWTKYGPQIPDSLLYADTTELNFIQDQVDTGAYPLSFFTPGRSEAPVNVILYNGGNPVISDSDFINAYDFSMKLGTNAAITYGVLQDSARVYGYYFDTVPARHIPLNEILNNSLSDFNALRSATVKGVYPVSFKTRFGTVANILVMLLDNDTIVPNPNGSGAIGANAVVWNRKDLLTTYNGIMVVDTAHVDAYDSLINYVSRLQIYLDTVKYNYILSRDTVGIYPMTYYMPGGLGAPEYTLVFDNDSITPNPTPGIKEAIGADNYTWNIKDLANLNLTTSRDTAHVTAMGYDSTFVPRTSITQDVPQFNNILAQTSPIVLPLTYTTPKGTSVTINVFLTGDSTSGGSVGADTMITASNFTWKIKNLSALTDLASRDSSKVTAIDTMLHLIPQNEIFVDTAQLSAIKLQTIPVVMPLSYTTGSKTVHINVTLLDDSTSGGVVGTDTVITANNFTWKIKNLSALTDSTSRTSSGVTALDTMLQLIPQAEIQINGAELTAIQSQTTPVVMPLSYTTGSKTVHINVFLEGDSTNGPIPPVIGQDTIITANNFTWKIKDLLALNDLVSRDSSKVTAIDLQLHLIPQNEIFVDTAQLSAIKLQTIPVVMPLSYTTGSQTVHINVTLLDDSTSGGNVGTDTVITANNFTWKIKNLSALTDSTSRTSSGVTALDTMLQLIPQAEIQINGAELTAIQSQTTPVVMPLSYTTGSKTVHINVFLEGDSTNGPIPPVIGQDTIITANNFTWKIKDLLALNDLVSRDSSKVTAIDLQLHLIPQNEIFVDTAQLSAIKLQTIPVVMPLSYTTGSQTVHINVTLLDDSTSGGVVGTDTVITANNFTWKIKNLSALTDSTSRTSSGVTALDTMLQLIPQAEIQINGAELTAIQSQTTPVVMPLSYTTGSKTVHINVFLEGDSTNGPIPPVIGQDTIITANNFTWKIKDLLALNDLVSRDSSKVTAIDLQLHLIPQNEIFVDTAQLSAIKLQTIPVVMPLSYTTGSQTVHINVTLLDDSTSGGVVGTDTVITANNFTWKIKNLSALTDSTSRTSSGVTALDTMLQLIPQAEIQINGAELTAIQSQTTPVVMPLSYTTGSKTVHINVFLEGDSTNGPIPPVIGQDTIITANNFTWKIKDLLALNDLVSRDSSKVTAIDLQLHLIPQNEIFVDTAQLSAIKLQTIPVVMPLSYTTGSQTVHINVTLLDDSTSGGNVGTDTVITANNFTWKIKNLSALTDSTSRTSSGVTALDTMLQLIPQAEIQINGAELTAIQSQTTPVVMPLSYTTGSKTVHINVFLEGDSTNGPIPPVIGQDTIITANNFTWKIKDLLALNDLVSRDSSKVTAIDLQLHLIPQNEIFVDTAQLSAIKLQTIPVVMPLSYTTGSQTVHINVTLLDDSTSGGNVGTDTVITANNFTWKIKNLSALTDSTSRTSSGVTALDTMLQLIPQAEIQINGAELTAIQSQTTPVVMPLSYTTGSKTVHINVFLEGDSTNGPIPPVIGQDTIITANNFTWKIKDLLALNDLVSRDSSKVTAIDLQLHLIPQNEIFVDTAQLSAIKLQTIPVVMPLSYTTGSQTVHINVTLLDDSTSGGNVGTDTVITANNFTWKIKNLSALTDSTSRTSSGVTALDTMLQLIPQAEIQINGAELTAIQSQTTPVVMPLSYTTGSKTVHINVFLEGDSTNGPIPPVIGQDTIITANNFTWKIKDLLALNDLVSRDSSKVTAIDLQLHLIPQNEIFVDTAQLSAIKLQTIPVVMPLSYTTGSQTVHINVFLEGDSTNGPIPPVIGVDTVITASNFSWMVKDLPSLTDASSRISSGVAAIDSALHAIPQGEIFIDGVQFASIKAQTQSAVMPLSYRTGTHVVHINVTLWATDTVAPSPNGGIGGIGADVVVWKLKDLSNYTQAIAPDTAHVVAFYGDGTTVPRSLITTDTVKYNYIMSQDTVGFFPMTYISPDTFVTDYVIVLDNDTITPNPTGREVIGADDYIWPLRKRANINAATAKKAAKVSAYHYDGTVIPRGNITANAVDLNALRAMTTSGSDSLTFSTPGNITSTRIKVTLVDNDTTTIDSITGEAIGANNFAWNIRNLNTLTKNISKDTAHVNAEYRDGRKISRSSLFVNGAQFATITAQTTPGVWPLTYTTPDGVSVTVNVALLDNDSIHVDPVKDEVIGADNFAFYVESLDTLDNVVARDTAHTKAFNMITGAEILRNTLLVDPSMLSVIKAQTGVTVLPLKFTTPGGTSTTINVTLMVDSTGTYDPDCHEYLYGKDFVWGIDSVSQLSDAIIRAYGKIGGIYTDGSGKAIDPSNITLNASDIAAAQAISVQDTGVYIHYSTNSTCNTTDSLMIYITPSTVVNPKISAGFIVNAVPLQLCDSLCDVDVDYVQAKYWGVDTMKYHATLVIKLEGSYKADAVVSLAGVPASLYTTNLPSNGVVHLAPQGSESVATVEIYRDRASQPTFGGNLTVTVNLAGVSTDVNLKFSNDFDSDGIANAIERSACIKKTHGIFNEWYFNSPYDDADGDGIADIVEAHGNMDSLYTTFTLPGACVPDFQNDDSNGDGVPDDNEKYTDNTNDTINNRDIHVRPAVSPNGDGLGDDQMFIENINFYPQNTVTIFDRVGHILFKIDNYDNKGHAFNGYPNQGYNDKKVPLGTYYYFVEYYDAAKDQHRKASGFIEVRY